MYTTEHKKQLIKSHTPRSPFLKNGLRAFIFGGTICAIGEIIFLLLKPYTDENSAYVFVSCFFVFLSSFLTCLGVFDRIARHAGAGTLVPVTGFSNSVTSSATDAKNEGFILGVGAKIFSVAGPVILYGILSGFIYGVVYYLYLILV